MNSHRMVLLLRWETTKTATWTIIYYKTDCWLLKGRKLQLHIMYSNCFFEVETLWSKWTLPSVAGSIQEARNSWPDSSLELMNSTASWRATWTSNLIVPTGVKKSHYYWKCMFSWIHSHIPRVEDCSIESRAVWTPLRGKASSHHWWYQLPSLSPNLHDKIHNYITYMNENVYMKINT